MVGGEEESEALLRNHPERRGGARLASEVGGVLRDAHELRQRLRRRLHVPARLVHCRQRLVGRLLRLAVARLQGNVQEELCGDWAGQSVGSATQTKQRTRGAGATPP